MYKREIIDKLRRMRSEDQSYTDGRILSSVSTKPLNVAIKAYEIFSDTNALDTHVFRSVERLERDIIEWFGKLLKNRKTAGYITTGGTEANIVALFVAKKTYPKKREILVPESAHYSIQRAADLLGLRIKYVPLDRDFRVDVSEIENRINKDTLAIVATAGTSALGVVDPIEEINELCGNIFFHVDAAFGGFVIPFLDSKLRIDFSIENMDSITIDPHKMGLAPIPSGAILFRDKSYLDKLKTSPTYLPSQPFTLSGSRSGGAIAATWATINYLGMDGYRRIVKRCMENTRFLCRELRKMDVNILVEPELNVVGIRPRNLERVWTLLRGRGWNILMDTHSKSLRVVVMPHVTEKVIGEFVRDLREIIQLCL
ncbi:MAG: tyrosine decarboxylase MfnA [Candidatus Altiarchaeales archaeon]|nr:MAG: tyrosine decarboxylase MfnA [Candidatus Altiarchaeales archaeon]